MVRFKFKTFLLSLIGIVAIATSSAFAYFIFNDEVKSSQLIEDQIKLHAWWSCDVGYHRWT